MDTSNAFSTEFDFNKYGPQVTSQLLSCLGYRVSFDGSLPNGLDAVYTASLLGRRRVRVQPKPLPLENPKPSSTSGWFDDSPTQSIFSIDNEKTSIVSWDTHSQGWWDDSPIHATFSERESDTLSMSTFGRGLAISPSETSGSCGTSSSTMVSTEAEGSSIHSLKLQSLDALDDQLITSPLDSFAAECWNSAVLPEPQTLKPSERIMELRLSQLYSKTAQEYEDHHSEESVGQEFTTDLPHMRFTSQIVPQAEEVTPWLHLPEKAVSILDIPKEGPLVPPRPWENSRSRKFLRGHGRGQRSLNSITKLSPVIAGKCKKAIDCMGGSGQKYLTE